MRALITGAAGFIGSTLATALTDKGVEVVGIDCFTDYYARSIKEQNVAALRRCPSYRLIEGELQRVDLAAALEGVTHVFHLAAQAGVRGSWGDQFKTYTSNNVDATQRLLEAVKGRPIERLVYASSSSVYGDVAAIPMREDAYLQPVSPYGVTKLAAEHLCHLYHVNHGVPTVSLRYFTVYGPRQRPDMAFNRFINGALTSSPIQVFGDGTQIRDFTYVDDVVEANVAAATSAVDPGTVVNISGGSQVSVNEVLAELETIAGTGLQVAYGDTVPGDVFRTGGDSTKARELLRWSPRTSLAEGLRLQFAAAQRRAR